jgi:hypothetical protein
MAPICRKAATSDVRRAWKGAEANMATLILLIYLWHAAKR